MFLKNVFASMLPDNS